MSGGAVMDGYGFQRIASSLPGGRSRAVRFMGCAVRAPTQIGSIRRILSMNVPLNLRGAISALPS